MKWPFESIGNLAKVNPRIAAADRPAPDEQVSFVPMAAISEKTCRIEEQTERCFAEVSKGYTPFRRGDVLIAKITPCFENGKMALAENLSHELGFGTTEFHVLRPSDKLIGAYLFNLLRAPFIRKAGAMKMKGAAGQRRVPADFFAALQIPLPPLAEQKRIAAILDAADALRAKRRETLAQLDTLLQSTFLDMFGDPVTNPKGWEKRTLKETFNFTTGKLDSNAAVVGGCYPFFTCSRETYAINDFAFDCEALLLSGNNANADYSVKHYKGKFNAYQRTYVITVDNNLVTYEYSMAALNYLLTDLKRFSKGTNTKYLTMVILNRMPILAPPLALQKHFSAIVESVEKQKNRLRAHLAELDTLFASLQDRAFKGAL